MPFHSLSLSHDFSIVCFFVLFRFKILKLVDNAVEYAIQANESDEDATVSLAIDRLSVNLGAAIAMIVPGYISTEVDPRLSFDTEASVQKAYRIIDMYKGMGVPKERVLIKLAATWEGIKAAEILEKDGIQCNLTLVFSFIQAVACAQYGAHLISPFPGRVLDWYKFKQGRTEGVTPEDDEGVVVVKKMYNYFKVRKRCNVFAFSLSSTVKGRPQPFMGNHFLYDETNNT